MSLLAMMKGDNDAGLPPKPAAADMAIDRWSALAPWVVVSHG
jgi:hypothetical protein